MSRLVCLFVLLHVCAFQMKAKSERDDKNQQVYPFQLMDFSPLKSFKTLNVSPSLKAWSLLRPG